LPDASSAPPRPDAATRRLPLPEFVALTAMLMASNALAIDIMLPALPDIVAGFGRTDDNDRQAVIISYMLGFGVSQLVYGPLTDRYGRRSVLFVSLAFYVAAGVACALAPSFETLIAARAFQGASAGGSRVIAVSAARDLYSGRTMAKVMSWVMMVFMIAPILAPWIGQQMLHVTDWRGVMASLAIFGAALLVWVWLRMPETLARENRAELNPAAIARNYRSVLSTRVTLGYTIASGFLFAALMSYVSASEQIYRGAYDTGEAFPLWFAGAAIAMTASNLVNSRLVERLGMRRLSHAALIGFVAVSAVHALASVGGTPPFVLFYALIVLSFFTIGFQGPNYNAIAMEPLGRLAGSGAAVIGFASSFVSAALGGLIAAQFDGTTSPVIAGHVVVASLALAVILITERGRLFGVRPAPRGPS
jgi:DHA1 family bicyclomycin/chloramphenicol resistance-like MFS transporter